MNEMKGKDVFSIKSCVCYGILISALMSAVLVIDLDVASIVKPIFSAFFSFMGFLLGTILFLWGIISYGILSVLFSDVGIYFAVPIIVISFFIMSKGFFNMSDIIDIRDEAIKRRIIAGTGNEKTFEQILLFRCVMFIPLFLGMFLGEGHVIITWATMLMKQIAESESAGYFTALFNLVDSLFYSVYGEHINEENVLRESLIISTLVQLILGLGIYSALKIRKANKIERMLIGKA